jgi:ABC-type antimicrobial peptide transport system ATPase subunit
MNITISGKIGDGKSSLALLIEEYLKSLGFEIQQNDEDLCLKDRLIMHQNYRHQYLDETLKKSPKIEINTRIIAAPPSSENKHRLITSDCCRYRKNSEVKGLPACTNTFCPFKYCVKKVCEYVKVDF